MTRPRLTAATTLAATLAAALTLTAPLAWAEDRTPATITVTGEGMTELAPDLATLTIGVTTTGETAAEALAANSAALDAVLQRLKAAGVEDRDLQTANLSVNPNWSSYDSSSSGAQTIDGYTAMNVVSVRIRALEGLGAECAGAGVVAEGDGLVPVVEENHACPAILVDADREGEAGCGTDDLAPVGAVGVVGVFGVGVLRFVGVIGPVVALGGASQGTNQEGEQQDRGGWP